MSVFGGFSVVKIFVLFLSVFFFFWIARISVNMRREGIHFFDINIFLFFDFLYVLLGVMQELIKPLTEKYMKIIYIDTQNIHRSTQEMWWLIDWWLFYQYLQRKFLPDKIIMFIWYIQKYTHFYQKLTKIWYIIVFKEVLVREDWSIKWDVDIDIAIQAMKDMYKEPIKSVYLVSGDADYNSLIYERIKEWIFEKLIVPRLDKTLYILRKASGSKLQTLTDIKHLIEKKQKD